MRKLIALTLAAVGLLSIGAHAQDTGHLVAHFQSLQTALADVGQDLSTVIPAMQKQIQDDEAQKATLIEWLKQAQAESAAKK
jgi:hypothetical protein